MIEKSTLHREGQKIRFGVPIAKFNEDRRTVSGFASLDNLDQHEDIVPIDVAKKAFIKFRGNLREMHQPIAVGKVVSFSEEPFAADDGNVYNGIFVNSYVSKGAQDTWEKVLDGTLSGFSIGGIVKDEEKSYDPDSGRMVRTIKDLELFELSLVDNPANQYANIVAIYKLNDEMEASGIAAGVGVENVFWCETERIARVSSEDTKKCSCGTEMTNIGWVESGDQDSVSKVVHKFLDAQASEVNEKDSAIEQNISIKFDGGVLTTESLQDIVEELVTRSLANRGGVEELATEETTEATTEEATETPVEETVETVEEVVEDAAVTKAAEVSEVESDEKAGESFDIAKAFESFADTFKNEITKINERLDTVTESLTTVKSLEEAQTKISESIEDVKKDVTSVSTTVGELSESTERLEQATAVKKSGDLESASEEPTTRKSLWGGRFISSNALAD